jgi:hypothetical protein
MAREVIPSEEFVSKDPTSVVHVARFHRAFLGRFLSGGEAAYRGGEPDAGRRTG